MSTPREYILDDELRKIVLRENAERLFKACKKITEVVDSPAKRYLTETRKIPISTLELAYLNMMKKQVKLVKRRSSLAVL
jgi:hypothetical protein